MKKVFRSFVYIAFCIILQVNLTCCHSKPQYYTIEDFDFVVIDKTTIDDIYEVVQVNKFSDKVAATSYGASQTFPMQDGRFIEIKYKGPDMVVFSIEIVKETQGDGSMS